MKNLNLLKNEQIFRIKKKLNNNVKELIYYIYFIYYIQFILIIILLLRFIKKKYMNKNKY